mmetsp:Transcript_10224/g.14926  ORF Transcript_10224/g.14926 Transcript_10224/m.14926 type:complete len:202 (+) Transcript_10224:695-1300(+)
MLTAFSIHARTKSSMFVAIFMAARNSSPSAKSRTALIDPPRPSKVPTCCIFFKMSIQTFMSSAESSRVDRIKPLASLTVSTHSIMTFLANAKAFHKPETLEDVSLNNRMTKFVRLPTAWANSFITVVSLRHFQSSLTLRMMPLTLRVWNERVTSVIVSEKPRICRKASWLTSAFSLKLVSALEPTSRAVKRFSSLMARRHV